MTPRISKTEIFESSFNPDTATNEEILEQALQGKTSSITPKHIAQLIFELKEEVNALKVELADLKDPQD